MQPDVTQILRCLSLLFPPPQKSFLGSLKMMEDGLVRQAMRHPPRGPQQKAILRLVSQALGLTSPVAEPLGSYSPQTFVRDVEVRGRGGHQLSPPLGGGWGGGLHLQEGEGRKAATSTEQLLDLPSTGSLRRYLVGLLA